MEHFKSDINSRREMEIKYYKGLNKRMNTSDINSSTNKATMTDRVKMDTYFMNMANTAKDCLSDDNCRRYLSDTMTDQRKKKKQLKDNIYENMNYSRYSSNQAPNPDKIVHYSRMYGPGNVASNFVVDSSNDVAPNFRKGNQPSGGTQSSGGVTQSRGGGTQSRGGGTQSRGGGTQSRGGVTQSRGGVTQSDDQIYSIPDELKNLNITGGVNISGRNPQIR